MHHDWDRLYQELATLIDACLPEDEQIQPLMDRHYEIACRFYRPSKEAYIGMGLFYASNEPMREFHNSYHPRMVEFLGQSMWFHAQRNLE